MASSSEQFTHNPETLTAEQESLLFGDQGVLETTEESDDMFELKLDLAYDWLAQHWAEPIPEEVIIKRADVEAFVQNWAHITGEHDTFKPIPRNPIAHALGGEDFTDEGWQPSNLRPILNTALLHTFNALANDPLRKEKIDYVINLIDEHDDYGWQNSGKGPFRGHTFPKPVEGF